MTHLATLVSSMHSKAQEEMFSSLEKSSLLSEGHLSDLWESAAVHCVYLDHLRLDDEVKMSDDDHAVVSTVERFSVMGSDTPISEQETETRSVGGIPPR